MRARAAGAVLVFLVFAATGCTGAGVRIDETPPGQYHPAGDAAVRSMLDSVSALAKKSPLTYSADFMLTEAPARGNTASWEAPSSTGQCLMHVAFKDFIFKSTVTMFFQEGDTIRVYYPVEKDVRRRRRTFDPPLRRYQP